jgi:hypothetical protein
MITFSMRSGAALLLGASLAAGAGCEFVSAVDRTDIPGGTAGGGGSAGGGQGGSAGGGAQGGSGGAAGQCSDGVRNGAETDVDCGGGDCPPCGSGQGCSAGTDCASGVCTGGTCVDVVLISEIRTRGLGGATDEFIELYNPTTADLTLDNSWRLEVRDVGGGQCANTTYVGRWSGNGEVVPAHGHLLIAASGYTQDPAADFEYAGGGLVGDAASVRLMRGADVADAVCLYTDQASLGALTMCSNPYTCEGTPVMNPHDGAGSNTDESLERTPGGDLGNAGDTGDNSMDFQIASPALPQNVMSAPTP